MRQQFKDAQAALPFVIGQGRNLETRIYTKRYPAYDYANVVPVVTEGNEWSIGTLFQIVDTTGEAKFISGSADDLPLAGATRDQATHDFAMVGAGWDWNMEQVNQASMYGINLTDTKAMAAANGIERLLYNVAMSGSTEKNWTGFANDGTVARTDAAGTGSGSSTFWSAKTPDNQLADINAALGAVRTGTSEVEYADTVALPPEAFRTLSTTRMGAGDGTLTVLEFLKKNNIYTAETDQPLSIIPVRALATASNDGGGRMVAYRKDPDVVRFHLPMPRKVLPVQPKGLMGFEQGAIARTGGVEWRLPGAAHYLDEITDVPA